MKLTEAERAKMAKLDSDGQWQMIGDLQRKCSQPPAVQVKRKNKPAPVTVGGVTFR